jgi:hypothetical protein
MLPKRSAVLFADLREFLAGLGFKQSRRGKFWSFEHGPSETTLLYRPYRVRERVTLLDLHRTRQDLDLRGVLEEEEFDDLLKKATA